MSPEAVSWLNQFANQPINDHQRLALVYLRHNDRITNGEYQRLTYVDSVTANRELRELVQSELLEQHRRRRWAYYTLTVSKEVKVAPPLEIEEEKILAYVKKYGSIKRAECQRLLGFTQLKTRYILGKIHKKGLLRLEGSRKGSRYVLP